MKKLVALVLAATLLLAASPSMAAEEASTTTKVLMTVGDVLVMRPFTLAATVVGFAVFVVGYPVILLSGSDTGWEDLVAKPGRATFTRCIGCDLIEEPPSEAPDEAP